MNTLQQSDPRDAAARRFPQRPMSRHPAVEERRFLRRLYWWSFLLRAVAALIGWFVTFVIKLPFLQDPLYYDWVGAHIANDWLNGRPSSWLATVGQQPHQPVAIVTLIACFYTLTLGVRALPVLLVAYGAITAYTPLVIYRIARSLGASTGAARTGAWLVALCPAFVFFSGALHKDGLILLLLSLGLHHALLLQSSPRPRSIVIICLCILGIVGLRLYLALVLVGVLAFGLILGRTRLNRIDDAWKLAVRQVLMFFVFTALMLVVGIVGQVQKIWPENLHEGFEYINLYRQGGALFAESGYLPQTDVSTPLKAAKFLPVGVFYFLTVPWPWDFGSLRQNLAIPDTALWVLLYPFALAGGWQALRRNFHGSALLWTTAVVMCCFYGLYIGNIGTAYRMRVQVWLLMAPFVGMGWQWWRGRPAFAGMLPRPVRRPWRGVRPQPLPERPRVVVEAVPSESRNPSV